MGNYFVVAGVPRGYVVRLVTGELRTKAVHLPSHHLTGPRQ